MTRKPTATPAVSNGRSQRQNKLRLGAALREAWVGYRIRLDDELASAGFADRTFPDGRVLRICAKSVDVTISQIGRELGISRQGASKLVGSLRDRGYVTLRASPNDGREKVVALTRRATRFLAAQREASTRIEHELVAELGAGSLDVLYRLLDVLAHPDHPRLSEYLRKSGGAAS